MYIFIFVVVMPRCVVSKFRAHPYNLCNDSLMFYIEGCPDTLKTPFITTMLEDLLQPYIKQ